MTVKYPMAGDLQAKTVSKLVGNPSRSDFDFADEYRRLLIDPDPQSMTIIEDLVIEHGRTLTDLSGAPGAPNGTFDIGSSTLPDGRVTSSMGGPREQWKMVQWNVRGYDSRGEIDRVGPRQYDITIHVANGVFRLKRTYHVQGGYEYARASAASDAWAVATALKTVPLSDDPDNYALMQLVDRTLDQDNSEPEEVFRGKRDPVVQGPYERDTKYTPVAIEARGGGPRHIDDDDPKTNPRSPRDRFAALTLYYIDVIDGPGPVSTARRVFVKLGPDPLNVVEQFETIEEAIDALAVVPQGRILIGNAKVGPTRMIGWVNRGEGHMNWAHNTLAFDRNRNALTVRFNLAREAAENRGLKMNPAPRGELGDVHLRKEHGKWHVDAQYETRTMNYGPFDTKDAGAQMREAIIESDLQRNPSDLVENPPWLTKAIADSYESLERKVDPKWLPRLDAVKATKGRLTARVKEYGCGAYGCVLPTLDPDVVLKATIDTTETEFARDLAGKLATPICTKYFQVASIPAKHRNRRVYLLWREAAEDVGKVSGPAVDAINRQHDCANAAYAVLHEQQGDAKAELAAWLEAVRAMARVPELAYVANGMAEAFTTQGVFIGDVHGGNLGKCKRDGKMQWVITDPGHVAVIAQQGNVDSESTRARTKRANPPTRSAEDNEELFWKLLKSDDAQDLVVAGDLVEENGMSIATLGELYSAEIQGPVDPPRPGHKQTRVRVSEGILPGHGYDDVTWEIDQWHRDVAGRWISAATPFSLQLRISRTQIHNRPRGMAATVHVEFNKSVTLEEARDIAARASFEILRDMKLHPQMDAEEVLDVWWGEQDHAAAMRGDPFLAHRPDDT